MSYSRDMTELAHATSHLVAAGPPRSGVRLDREQAARVLAARDAVVREVRALARGLVNGGPVSAADLRLEHIATDPAHVLHAALTRLARAGSPDEGSPSELLGAPDDDPRTAAWSAAGRAALTLEAGNRQVANLPTPAAWDALRDVAELAAALPVLDADLAAALPDGIDGKLDGARAVLEDHPGHALVRVAADAVCVQTAGLPGTRHLDLLDLATAATDPVPVPGPQALPDAARRLRAVLAQRGPHVAAHDLRAVAQLVGVAIHTAVLVAHRTGPTPDQAAAVRAFTTGRDALRQVDASRAASATLSPVDPRVRALTTEANARLRRMAVDSRDLDVVLGFARETPALVATALDAARAAGAAGKLLTRPSETTSGPEQYLHWLRVKPEHADRQPLIRGLSDATRHLTAAAPALDRTHAPALPAGAARLAAARTATAIDELRDALRARALLAPAALPPLTAHPAMRQHQQPPGAGR